ncbi:hypothetical protein [Actinoalloteichus hymeniacidonis]|uniref:Prokaryotic membrane lipoprotein lipid attachment site n=1 Tax=Actinoalloteichus hymeniacidonis TaxID=340345 RepID=A0AAC9MXB6_9PSEU|nr:hypothetical protein [Actinoalloteichus hymeniacidonis]AOS61727.1 hypothetical protein TL08_04485 [Actinoalloteichus hymeniacidonis]MBB5910255.1 hypothetical protein [Actinoalloteichus hymeniacidonis]
MRPLSYALFLPLVLAVGACSSGSSRDTAAERGPSEQELTMNAICEDFCPRYDELDNDPCASLDSSAHHGANCVGLVQGHLDLVDELEVRLQTDFDRPRFDDQIERVRSNGQEFLEKCTEPADDPESDGGQAQPPAGGGPSGFVGDAPAGFPFPLPFPTPPGDERPTTEPQDDVETPEAPPLPETEEAQDNSREGIRGRLREGQCENRVYAIKTAAYDISTSLAWDMP